ncbi:response regulator [Actinomadura syzygii]|uniref:response regulator n=1 Tax=Actinomadura syzygii TaxID=1427538 RepID=UPI00361A08AA
MTASAGASAAVPIRIVLADDQPLIRAGLRVLVADTPDLEIAGEAGTGAEAVRLVEEARPDVVVMDIRMPDMDGIEATRRITERAREVHVLMLTTFDDDEYVYGSLRAGASGFLVKDMALEEILSAIRVVAKGDALIAPSVTRRLIAEFAARPTQPGPQPPTSSEPPARNPAQSPTVGRQTAPARPTPPQTSGQTPSARTSGQTGSTRTSGQAPPTQPSGQTPSARTSERTPPAQSAGQVPPARASGQAPSARSSGQVSEVGRVPGDGGGRASAEVSPSSQGGGGAEMSAQGSAPAERSGQGRLEGSDVERGGASAQRGVRVSVAGASVGRVEGITEREREVLILVGRGRSNQEIAKELFISPATSKAHVARLLTKLDARDRVQLVIIAYELGLVGPSTGGSTT